MEDLQNEVDQEGVVARHNQFGGPSGSGASGLVRRRGRGSNLEKTSTTESTGRISSGGTGAENRVHASSKVESMAFSDLC